MLPIMPYTEIVHMDPLSWTKRLPEQKKRKSISNISWTTGPNYKIISPDYSQ